MFSLPQEENCRQLKIEQIKVQRWVRSRNHGVPSSSPQTSTPRQASGSPLCLLLSLPTLPDLHPAGREDVQTAGCWQGSGSPEGGAPGAGGCPTGLTGRPPPPNCPRTWVRAGPLGVKGWGLGMSDKGQDSHLRLNFSLAVNHLSI